jgi:hypothetical protein
LFALLILACLTFLTNHLILYKALYPQTLAAWLLLGTFIALLTTLLSKAKKFQTDAPQTVSYFADLLQAEPIEKNQVPLIFQ